MMRFRVWLSAVASIGLACGGGAPDATNGEPGASSSADGGSGGDAASGAEKLSQDASLDAGSDASVPAASYDPVLLVHGIKGSAADFDPLKQALVVAGWPVDRILAKTFPDPSWGCNDDNAKLIATWVDAALLASGSDRVDIVAHSMGTLSSRYFMKHLGGTGKVRTYVTLGGMHHGLSSSCLSPLPVCVWQQLCSTGPFIADLNASGPAVLGPTKWVSIFSTGDKTVPVAASNVAGAENIQLSGIEHDGANGLQASPLVHVEVARVLRYAL